MKDLAAKYNSQDVAIIGIDSNQQDAPTELARYARTHDISFPLLKDPGNRVADQFGAERTPEAFVLDRDRKVRYWGRIDDQFGVGYARQKSTQNYVANAIDDLLAGRPVNTPHVDSVGCYIGRVSRVEPRATSLMRSRFRGSSSVAASSATGTAASHRSHWIVRDGGGLGGDHPRSGRRSTHAPLACESEVRPVRRTTARMPNAEKELLYQWVANGVPKGAEGDLPPKREFAGRLDAGRAGFVVEDSQTDHDSVQRSRRLPICFRRPRLYRREVGAGVGESSRACGASCITLSSSSSRRAATRFSSSAGSGLKPWAATCLVRRRWNWARALPATFLRVRSSSFRSTTRPTASSGAIKVEIGLYFADPATVRRTMQTGVAANLDFVVPPGAEDYRVEAAHRFSHDMELHALSPHMHYRGKAFRFEATYPNGSREILLDVPRYDFNWQNTYRFAKPKFMPEGTLLRCIAQFDNSEHNLSNPDPNAAVRWGEQTWDEMMIGYFEGSVSQSRPVAAAAADSRPRARRQYRVRFTFRPDRPARTVNVAGTFNDWNTSSHPLTDPDGDGLYVADVTTEGGRVPLQVRDRRELLDARPRQPHLDRLSPRELFRRGTGAETSNKRVNHERFQDSALVFSGCARRVWASSGGSANACVRAARIRRDDVAQAADGANALISLSDDS